MPNEKIGLPNDSTTPPFWGPKVLSGWIWSKSDPQHRAECTLTGTIDSTGSLLLRFDHILLNDSTAFLTAASGITSKFPEFILEAKSEDGYQLSTHNLILTSPYPNYDENKGSYFSTNGGYGSVKIRRIKLPNEISGTVVWRLIGYRTMHPMRIATPYGELNINGVNHVELAHMSGAVALRAAPEIISDLSGRGQVDDFLDHVTWVASFAMGTSIKIPVRIYTTDDQTEFDVINASACQPTFLPPFHHWMTQPLLKHAVAAYSKHTARCKRLHPVIEYVLINANYTEPRLAMTIIALEHLVNKCLDPEEVLLIEKTAFGKLCQELSKALDAYNMKTEDKDYIKEVVVKSNWLSFRAKIEKFLDKWQVPLNDFPPRNLRDIVRTRNAIAHGRILREDSDLKGVDPWDTLLAARELMTRIILTGLEYKGTYQSYVGGHHIRLFPSCQRQS